MEGDLPNLIIGLSVIFGLFLLNAVFIAGEVSLLNSRRDILAPEGELVHSVGQRWAIGLLARLDYHVLTIRFFIVVESLLIGALGCVLLNDLSFYVVGEKIDGGVIIYPFSRFYFIAFGLFLIAVIYLVFLELVIKHISIRRAEKVLSFLSGPILVVSWFCRPITAVCIWVANVVLGLCGVSSAVEVGRVHSANELAKLIEQSTASGELDKGEEEMLHGVFGFSDTVAREVMTPRPDLITISLSDSLKDIVSTIVESGHSRFPVIDDSVDNIVGILLAKDVMPLFEKSLKHCESVTCESFCHHFDIRSVIRESYFIPGSKPIDDLLNEFKLRKLHMAVVLDEHGGVDGVVTLEDLIEEIVGEIYDESDVAEANIVVDENGDVLIDGGMLVADINDRFDIEIPEGDYDTIAGFIFSTLGRVPAVGDVISVLDDGHVRCLSSADMVSAAKVVQQADNTLDSSAVSNSVVLSECIKTNGDVDTSDLKVELIVVFAIAVEKIDGNRIETVRFRKFS